MCVYAYVRLGVHIPHFVVLLCRVFEHVTRTMHEKAKKMHILEEIDVRPAGRDSAGYKFRVDMTFWRDFELKLWAPLTATVIARPTAASQ